MAGISRDCLNIKFEDGQKITFGEHAQGILTFDVFVEDLSVTISRLVSTDR
jgi:hypothetical protein